MDDAVAGGGKAGPGAPAPREPARPGCADYVGRAGDDEDRHVARGVRAPGDRAAPRTFAPYETLAGSHVAPPLQPQPQGLRPSQYQEKVKTR
jgi:hypothetical protein